MQLASRAMMVQLGFIQDAANEIFNGQGIDLIDEWLNLDNEDVKTLLWNVRKPVGGVQGEMISFKAEMKLHLTVSFVFLKRCASQSVDYGNTTVPNICALKKQIYLGSAKEKNPEAPTINLKDVSKKHEEIMQYVLGIRVYDGVPLSYVAQPTSNLMPIS